MEGEEEQKEEWTLDKICHERYLANRKKYCMQFRNDIEEMGSLQSYALAGVRLQRMFCIGLRMPKLKNELTPREMRKLQLLIETP